jgi:hypothetical protein
MYKYAVHKFRSDARRWDLPGHLANGEETSIRGFTPRHVKVEFDVNDTERENWSGMETIYFDNEAAAAYFIAREATKVPGAQFILYELKTVTQATVGPVVQQRMTEKGLVPA